MKHHQGLCCCTTGSHACRWLCLRVIERKQQQQLPLAVLLLMAGCLRNTRVVPAETAKHTAALLQMTSCTRSVLLTRAAAPCPAPPDAAPTCMPEGLLSVRWYRCIRPHACWAAPTQQHRLLLLLLTHAAGSSQHSWHAVMSLFDMSWCWRVGREDRRCELQGQ